MAYETKPNTGSLFKNDRKESDNHADYKGKLNVDGVDYWLDGWIKDGANGKFISGTIKPKEQSGGGHTPLTRQPAPIDLNDDVPFISCDPSLECRVR